ncbi:MAG: rhomboid family intramembrane serine protease [Myxococcales bacterium]|nr:rhomboid family intramembrane serine protease [Myxococcales bacterium]
MSHSEGSSSHSPSSRGSGSPGTSGLHSHDEPIDELAVFAGLMSSRPVRLTYAFIGLYIVLFGLSELWGGSDSTQTLSAMGAQFPLRIQLGEYWRLLSATALHGGLLHIVLNSYVLYGLGPFLEKLLGWQRFVVLYILAGLAGTLLSTLIATGGPLQLSVGASGCLFGLLGGAAVLAFRDFGLPSQLVQDLRKASLINLGLNVVASLRPNVDWVAHLGGGLCGVLLMLVVIRPKLDEEETRKDQVFTALAGLCLFALLTSVLVAIWQGQPWLPPPADLSFPSIPQ